MNVHFVSGQWPEAPSLSAWRCIAIDFYVVRQFSSSPNPNDPQPPIVFAFSHSLRFFFADNVKGDEPGHCVGSPGRLWHQGHGNGRGYEDRGRGHYDQLRRCGPVADGRQDGMSYVINYAENGELSFEPVEWNEEMIKWEQETNKVFWKNGIGLICMIINYNEPFALRSWLFLNKCLLERNQVYYIQSIYTCMRQEKQPCPRSLVEFFFYLIDLSF